MSQARRSSRKSTARKETSLNTEPSSVSTTNFFLIISQQGRVIFRKSVPHLPLQMTLEPVTQDQCPSLKLAICPSGKSWLFLLEDSRRNISIPVSGLNWTWPCDSDSTESFFMTSGADFTTNLPKAESTKTDLKRRTGGRTSLRFKANGLSQAQNGGSTGRG